MKLILGGAYQGKRSFAQAQYHCKTWFDFQTGQPQTAFDGFCHLEELTRRETLRGGSAAALLARMAPYWANAVVVSREIGSRGGSHRRHRPGLAGSCMARRCNRWPARPTGSSGSSAACRRC